MKYHYTRPSLENNFWLVNKEDIKKIFTFFKNRFNQSEIGFELNTKSGNNRIYDSFEEFENDVDVILSNKETVQKITLKKSLSDKEGRVFIWFEIDFNLNATSLNIVGEDNTGGKKDWIDGAYEEMTRLSKSFEIEDEEMKKYVKEKYGEKWRDKAIVEDFNQQKEKAIKDKIKKDSSNEQGDKETKPESFTRSLFYDPWTITIVGGVIVLVIAYFVFGT